MVKSKEKRKIDYFLSYWGLLLLTIFLAFFFFHKNWFSSDSKPSIARIVETKGNVFFRSESFSGWDSAIPNQEIYGGDSVATGSDSGSVFSFSNKQNISIDQNTQIIFLSGPENQIKIELIKGFIEVRGLVDRKVEIVSGGENYIFEGEKNQCLRKNIDTNPKFGCDDQPQQIEPSAVEQEAIVQIIEKNIEEKTPVASGKSPISAEGHRATISGDISQGDIVWISGSFKSRDSFPILIVKGGKRLNEDENWTAVVEVMGSNGRGRGISIQGRPSRAQSQNITIPLSKVLESGASVSSGTISFVLRAGLKVNSRDGRTSNTQFGSETYSFQMKSLVDSVKLPAEIGLGNLSIGKSSGGSFVQKVELTVRQSAIRVVLYSRDDLEKFTPYLANGSFYLQSTRPLGGAQYYILRGSSVIGGVLANIDTSLANRILGLLNANMIFRGQSNDFYYIKGQNSDKIMGWATSQSSAGRALYAVRNRELIPIASSFIQSGQILNIIGKNADYIFLDRVSVLASAQ